MVLNQYIGVVLVGHHWLKLVIYKDKLSSAIDVAFKVIDTDNLLKSLLDSKINEIDFVIWTTTPWTLPANQAVAVGEAIDYILLEIDKRRPQFGLQKI